MMPPSDLNNPSGALSPAENASRALQPRTTPVHASPVPHTPPALSAAPNAFTLLKALRHRLGMALTTGLILAAIVGGTVWFSLPSAKFTARMQLHVALAPPHNLFPNKEDGHLNGNFFLRSQAFLIRNHFSLIAALRDPAIANLATIKEQIDPVQWLDDRLVIDFPSPEFIYISLSGDRPDELKKIVLAVTKAYMANFVEKEKKARDAKRKSLEAINEKGQLKWNDMKKALQAKQKRAPAIDQEGMQFVQQMALEELQSVKKQIAEVHNKILLLQVEMGLHPDWEEKYVPHVEMLLNSQLGRGAPAEQAVIALLHDESLFALPAGNFNPINQRALDDIYSKDKELTDKLVQVDRLKELLERTKQMSKSPKFFKERSEPLREAVAKLEEEINNRRRVLKERWIAGMRDGMHEAIQSQRMMRINNFRGYQALERELRKAAKDLHDQCGQNNKETVDLIQSMDDIEAAKKLVQRTNDQLQIMEVERDAPQRINLSSEEAIIVNTDETKRKLTMTAGSAFGALALVLLAFAFFEFQSRKVYTSEEVVRDLGLQLVGTVPDHSPRGWLPWSRTSDADTAYTQSMLTESVDTARTMLLHIARHEQLQIVMITSALSGEGKTSLASHLAASLARAGRRTILLDSDLRNPTLHRLFERDRAPGLSELLRGEADLANVIGETAIPNLWLVAAGKADTVALQALALEVLPKLFERLRLHYDFVIVDSCPVLPVADAMLVGQHVDAVIFSLLREVSRMPRVYAAYQRLAVLGIRMLGAVVNGTQNDRYPTDYRYLLQDEESD